MESFTGRNGLKLNIEKLELLPTYKGSNLQSNEELQNGSASISASYNFRCFRSHVVQ